MAMKVATFNGCKVYNLSSGKTMPQWLSNTKKRALTKDEDYRKRLELIQDFEMTTASQCIKMTNDGEHIIVTGTYPPIVRCYTTSDMAMKFQRGLTCDVVAMETLSDDFSKIAFLQSDRTLSFHAPYGTHYNLRVPKFGRDLKYNWDNCDLYVASSGDELYRINLESGQFKEPFRLSYSGCNKVSINPVHSLVAAGGETGVCEFWDAKSRKAITRISVDKTASSDITALKFDVDGLTLGVGTSSGSVILYDIRSSKPIHSKDHQYGLPIVDITFHNSSRHIISTDKKIIKIWERDEPAVGKIMTNVETPCDINNILCVSDKRGETGLIMATGEQSRVMTYFIPQLGPAPRWCSFLESLTEELEETAGQSVYEDFKFLTKVEIEELGATGLIGTPMLKGYMHGFFIDMKLYNKLRAVSKPFEYEEHRKKKIRDKIEANRQSRIVAQKRLPKVNKQLAEKMLKTGSDDKKLVDDRFASLFEREEFQQDEEAIDFKLRNPTRSNKPRGDENDSDNDELNNIYSQVKETHSDEEEDRNDYYSDGQEDDSDIEAVSASKQYPDEDDDEFNHKKKGKKQPTKRRNSNNKNNNNSDDEDEGQISRATKKMNNANNSNNKETSQKRKFDRMFDGNAARVQERDNRQRGGAGASKMFELSDGAATKAALFGHTKDSKSQRQLEKQQSSMPISERLKHFSGESKAALRAKDSVRYIKTPEEGLVRELSYMPFEDKNKRGGKESKQDSLVDRRSDDRVEKFEGKSKSFMRNKGSNKGSGGSSKPRGGRR